MALVVYSAYECTAGQAAQPLMNDWRIPYIEQIINHLRNTLDEIYETTTGEIDVNRVLEKERIIENVIGMVT
jgi:hypothetical protein